MEDVKWIKIAVGMFDGMSFSKIRTAKNGKSSRRDLLTAVWIELLALAAKCNHGGAFIDNNDEKISTFDDFCALLLRKKSEIKFTFDFFLREKMISKDENGIYFVTNWSKYQDEDRLHEIRKKSRERTAKCRERQRQMAANYDASVTLQQCDSNSDVTRCNAIDVDVEEEIRNKINISSAVAEETRERACEDDNNDDQKKETQLTKWKDHVMLSDTQFESLADEMGIEAFDYYLAKLNKWLDDGHYCKSHYATMLKWYREDSAIAKKT